MRSWLALTVSLLATINGDSLAQELGRVPNAGLRLVWATDSIPATVDSAGGEALFRPSDLVLTPWGEVWVSDGGNHRVYRWSASGVPLPPVGRHGRGPGEFDRPSLIWLGDGGQVDVWDSRLQRVTSFDRSGEMTGMVEVAVVSNEHGFVRGMRILGDTAIVWTVNYPNQAPRANENRSYIWRFRLGSLQADSLFGLPSDDFIIDRDARSSSRFPAPFGRRPFVLLSEQGAIAGFSENSRFTRLGPDYRRLNDFEVDLPRRPVQRIERDAFTDSVRTGLSSALDRSGLGPSDRAYFQGRYQRMIRGLEFPELHPAYVNAWASQDNTIWLQMPTAREDRYHTLMEIDTSGTVLRSWQIPNTGHLRSAAFDDRGLFVIEVTAEGVPRLARYSL